MQADSIQLNPEVQKALLEGRAVVALESTIISHGRWIAVQIPKLVD
jgi:pseudouridine-5'-phosphate glycosidase